MLKPKKHQRNQIKSKIITLLRYYAITLLLLSGGILTLIFLNTSSVWAIEDTTPPSAPQNLTLSAPAEGQIQLNWQAATDPESGISGYTITRSPTPFPGGSSQDAQAIGKVAGNVLTFTDSTGIKGETYYYGVTATNGVGLVGPFSNIESITVTGKEVPHYNWSVATNKCRDCHKIHRAPEYVFKLLRRSPEIETCYVCHDGTGSDYNIRVTFENLAAHDTILAAPAGTNLKCIHCHNPHGVGQAWMTRASEENLCFNCHNTTTNSVNGWNIQEQFNRTSSHAITGTTGDGLTGAKVECTNCHNPHVSKRGVGVTDITSRLVNPFNTYNLWSGSTGPALFTNFCLQCHKDSGFPEATFSPSIFIPYTVSFPNMTSYPFFPGWDKTVFTSAGHSTNYSCQKCHHPHGSPNQRLNAFFDEFTGYDISASASKEENLCFQCHKSGGPSGAPDIQTPFNKTYKHPVTTEDKHKDTESGSDFGASSRHAECVDCHDPHQAQAGTHTLGSNQAGLVLKGVIGVTPENGTSPGSPASYTFANPITYEYELCFKCHSSYTNLPSGSKDKAAEFNPNNPSYHPVEDRGKNLGIRDIAFVLGTPWNPTTGDDPDYGLDSSGQPDPNYPSKITCTDCHNNDDPSGAKGPHGSGKEKILKEVPFVATPRPIQGYDVTSVCLSCHNYNTYVGISGTSEEANGTRFKFPGAQSEHWQHVFFRGISCLTCHETHGQKDRIHLIKVKDPNDFSPGVISWTPTSTGGSCSAGGDGETNSEGCHNGRTKSYTHNYPHYQ